MFAYGIFKVLYSPFKAFKEIIQNPKHIGPILIMMLFVFANTGFGYVVLSRSYIDQAMPPTSRLDEWTENCTLWVSNVGTPKCSEDHISGFCYGNCSINFTVINDSQIWMQLNTTDPVNCSSLEGFKTLSVKVKWIRIDEVRPNVTIHIFSSSSDYFRQDLTQNFTDSNSNVWKNLTIPLGSASEKWQNNSANARWEEVNGLELIFMWPSVSNITVLVDGLFFHGTFKPAIVVAGQFMLDYPLIAFMQFMIHWGILGGSLYITSKAFRLKVTWKVLFIIAGFALVTLLIQTIIRTSAFAVSPDIYYPLEALGSGQEAEKALLQTLEQSQFLLQFVNYVEIVMSVWTFALCLVAIYLLSDFSWKKSLPIAALAWLVYFLIVRGEIVRLFTL